MHETLNRLRAAILRHCPEGRADTGVSGLGLFTATAPTEPVSGVFQPTVCVVVQGAKRVTIGERTVRYDPAHYFVASVEVPATGCVCEASPEAPYLGLSLRIAREELASLLPEVGPAEDGGTAGFGIDRVTPHLLDGFERLLALLDNPEDIPALAPLVRREILYRLLRLDRGGQLRQFARADSQLSRVNRALSWIRAHYDVPLRIDDLTALAGMSRASFHRHFKAATAMSPLQFQKALRLQEARRRLAADPDAQRTAYALGYESASQFSREYARMFGQPPVRDAERLRREPEPAGGVMP
jgi:AraC-like DNA-binding protein